MWWKLTGKGETSNLLSEFDVRDTSWFTEVTSSSEEKLCLNAG